MSLFQNKYRVESTRLPYWDYGTNAPYFVTICTRNGAHHFGRIENDRMLFSNLGQMVCQFWNEIPTHFPFVVLDAWTVMPNHIHGIITIHKPDTQTVVPGEQAVSLSQRIRANEFGPQSQNLASIIRGFKVGVTKYAKENSLDFGWQPRFHDHVIRDEKSYFTIRNYIQSNVRNWREDRFYGSK